MNIIRNLVYSLLSIFDKLFYIKKPLIIVLCYHNIGNDKWKFSISKSVFERQINYLVGNREPISLTKLRSYLTGDTSIEKPSFVITFDDGCEGVMEIVDFVKSKNIVPTMFLIANSQEADRHELDSNVKLLNTKQISKLIKMGWEIGCHSMTHADFNKLGETLDQEINNSKDKLELDLGVNVSYFSFPKGKYNNEIITTLKKGKYNLAVTMDDGLINTETDIYTIPRIGVDKTHSFEVFKSAILSSSIQARSLFKKSFLFKYI